MRRWGVFLAFVLGIGLTAIGHADVVQHGKFRVAVDADLTPTRLPRTGDAPVRFALSARFIPTKGSTPPQLRKIEVKINRHGHLNPNGIPICQIDQIQPATTANALAACRDAQVGEGTFQAKVLFTQQAPFPSNGKLIAFNGRWHGRPAILAHIYGPKPIPTSNTIPFVITTRPTGTYGATLSASLPQFSGKWGYARSISLTLGGSGRYLTASCPAPDGVPVVSFPLSRTRFDFLGSSSIRHVVSRTCRPDG